MKNRRKNSWSTLFLGLALGLVLSSAGAQEPGYSDSWGPAVGAALPMLDARDQSGEQVRLGDLVGPKGLVLVLVRSADW